MKSKKFVSLWALFAAILCFSPSSTQATVIESGAAAESSGTYVLVWRDDVLDDVGDIYAFVHQSGAPVVRPYFLVNDDIEGSPQAQPVAALSSSGMFIVVWVDGRDGRQVFGQRYSPDGVPIGPNFPISDRGEPHSPNVVIAPDGSFAVGWVELEAPPSLLDEDSPANATGSLYVRSFDADALPVSEPTRVNQQLSAFNVRPAMDVASDGSFVIGWTEGFGEVRTVYARRFDSRGRPLGKQPVRVAPEDDRDEPVRITTDIAVAARDDGTFVAVWREDGLQGPQIWLRRYSTYGRHLSEPRLASRTAPVGDPARPSVALAGDGSLAIAWEVTRTTDHAPEIWGQCMDAQIEPVGISFRIDACFEDSSDPRCQCAGLPAAAARSRMNGEGLDMAGGNQLDLAKMGEELDEGIESVLRDRAARERAEAERARRAMEGRPVHGTEAGDPDEILARETGADTPFGDYGIRDDEEAAATSSSQATPVPAGSGARSESTTDRTAANDTGSMRDVASGRTESGATEPAVTSAGRDEGDTVEGAVPVDDRGESGEVLPGGDEAGDHATDQASGDDVAVGETLDTTGEPTELLATPVPTPDQAVTEAGDALDEAIAAREREAARAREEELRRAAAERAAAAVAAEQAAAEAAEAAAKLGDPDAALEDASASGMDEPIATSTPVPAVDLDTASMDTSGDPEELLATPAPTPEDPAIERASEQLDEAIVQKERESERAREEQARQMEAEREAAAEATRRAAEEHAETMAALGDPDEALETVSETGMDEPLSTPTPVASATPMDTSGEPEELLAAPSPTPEDPAIGEASEQLDEAIDQREREAEQARAEEARQLAAEREAAHEAARRAAAEHAETMATLGDPDEALESVSESGMSEPLSTPTPATQARSQPTPSEVARATATATPTPRSMSTPVEVAQTTTRPTPAPTPAPTPNEMPSSTPALTPTEMARATAVATPAPVGTPMDTTGEPEELLVTPAPSPVDPAIEEASEQLDQAIAEREREDERARAEEARELEAEREAAVEAARRAAAQHAQQVAALSDPDQALESESETGMDEPLSTPTVRKTPAARGTRAHSEGGDDSGETGADRAAGDRSRTAAGGREESVRSRATDVGEESTDLPSGSDAGSRGGDRVARARATGRGGGSESAVTGASRDSGETATSRDGGSESAVTGASRDIGETATSRDGGSESAMTGASRDTGETTAAGGGGSESAVTPSSQDSGDTSSGEASGDGEARGDTGIDLALAEGNRAAPGGDEGSTRPLTHDEGTSMHHPATGDDRGETGADTGSGEESSSAAGGSESGTTVAAIDQSDRTAGAGDSGQDAGDTGADRASLEHPAGVDAGEQEHGTAPADLASGDTASSDSTGSDSTDATESGETPTPTQVAVVMPTPRSRDRGSDADASGESSLGTEATASSGSRGGGACGQIGLVALVIGLLIGAAIWMVSRRSNKSGSEPDPE